jgi:hypothetical protein
MIYKFRTAIQYLMWVAISFIVSCSLLGEHKEMDVEKLKSILVDLYIADIAINKSSPEIRDSLRKEYKKQISAIHHMTPEELDSAILHAQLDIQRYREVNREALEELLKQKEAYSQ